MWRWILLFAVAAVLLAADQTAKYVVVRDLTSLFERANAESFVDRVSLFYGEPGIEHLRRQPSRLLPGWRFIYAENPGAALGLLGGRGRLFRVSFFGAVALLAGAFVLVMSHRIGPDKPLAHLALGAVLGGVAGNFACRLSRGYVIDFVDWHIGDPPRLHFPAFNIADVGITLGVVVLLTLTAREVMRRDS